MKRLLSLLLLLCVVMATGLAQEGKRDRNARVEAMRSAYITEQLDLTVEESQKFWPIFNEYEAERKKIKKSFSVRKDIDEMTEQEASDFVEQSLVRDQQMLDLKRTYFEKFRTAISIKKIARLPRIEKSFRQELIKRMRQNREGYGGRRRG